MKTASLTHTRPPVSKAQISDLALFSLRGYHAGRRRRPPIADYTFWLVVLGITLAMLNGCSPDSKPATADKPEIKPPDLVGALSGFHKSYVAAHGWNQDAKPYRIESVATNEGNGRDGKWTIWRSSFASASARSEKTFVWSGSNAQDAPSRGVNPGVEDSYSPSNASTQVFDAQFLKIDSDQALETAKKHGGDKILGESPDTPVMYLCDWNHNTNQLVWHVIFGPAREGAKLVVSVDASTGEFIRVEK
jgi:hypothetical protein